MHPRPGRLGDLFCRRLPCVLQEILYTDGRARFGRGTSEVWFHIPSVGALV